ncbi:MAG: bifunctional phosphoribosyl-AMP cyclohydrolase/phosphoribosyl-ATP diphosphatase HisIE [Saprospiraceae bacterium]|nr:bifunctional phosphoribosyl-AMP cyclohydrolase/phosphoribosyl-ATP diphosphatase HisIE [Saprospiraceae bacterium]MDP4998148.1 bifunctional phosphoribosyl-AMP cyclohydrolase/phosphoribosyl-ATP diphosphatase HisIE [Saprospiraceae bacterium]
MQHLDFDKSNGLIPAVVQDADTGKVLMLGYMDQAALDQTRQTGLVTFFSRSKNRLWTKGESSGNFLHLVDIRQDCDNDTLLVSARPVGPVCHTGSDTCFDEVNQHHNFLQVLEQIILDRKNHPAEDSYTARLLNKGINKVAQKVGEEAVELVIEAKDDNRDLFLNEAADLLYHYLVLLVAKGHTLAEVLEVLASRHKK